MADAEHLISVHAISSNCCIVPWSMVTIEPTSSFDNLLSSLKAGKYSVVSPSEFCPKRAWKVHLLGKSSRLMSVVGKDTNMSDVCHSFGSYVRLKVDDTIGG